MTIREIERDGFKIESRIECLLSSDTDVGMAKTIGLATLSLADLLDELRPDVLLLIADRYEMLAPAAVALALRIPIAHIEGGEISQGAIDDAVRNALTKLSHVHFTSTQLAKRRVIGMGEEEWRVHWAGAPSLDHLRYQELLNRSDLELRLGLKLEKPTILVIYHPVTIAQDTLEEADEVFSVVEQLDSQLLFCYPNADAGSRKLIEKSKELISTRPNGRVFTNLDAVTYLSLLRGVDVLIGNSSSGIMEAASFGLPVVNIGIRQQGRERAANVVDSPPDATSIQRAIGKALSEEFRRPLVGMTNPYGDGMAAEKIARVLATLPSTDVLLRKKHFYPDPSTPSE